MIWCCYHICRRNPWTSSLSSDRPLWNDTPHNLRGLRGQMCCQSLWGFARRVADVFAPSERQKLVTLRSVGPTSPQICPRSAESAGKISAHVPEKSIAIQFFQVFQNKDSESLCIFCTYTLMCRAYWRLSASLLLACPCQLCSFNHNKRLSFWPRSRGSPTCFSCLFVFFGLSYCAYDFLCLLTRWE